MRSRRVVEVALWALIVGVMWVVACLLLGGTS